MLNEYRQHTDFSALAVERAKLGIPPFTSQCRSNIAIMRITQKSPQGEEETLMMLLCVSEADRRYRVAYRMYGISKYLPKFRLFQQVRNQKLTNPENMF